jgi:hypothetical protein
VASSSSWKRTITQAVVIVTAILVAFWIDAMGEARQDRQELENLLQGLRAEFLINRDLLGEALALTEEARSRLQRFTAGSVDDVASIPTADTYVEVYLPLIRDWRARFSMGYYEAATAAGNLTLIRNPDTRAAVTGFRRAVESLDPLLGQLDRLGADAATVVGSYPGGRAMWGRDDSGFDSGMLRALHRDAELVGLASARLVNLGEYQIVLRFEVQPLIDEAVQLLERDLDEL